jgi:hypothetical protein
VKLFSLLVSAMIMSVISLKVEGMLSYNLL